MLINSVLVYRPCREPTRQHRRGGSTAFVPFLDAHPVSTASRAPHIHISPSFALHNLPCELTLMMLAAASVSYAPAVRPAARASSVVKMDIADKAGLENLAVQLNPVVGYWGAQCCSLL